MKKNGFTLAEVLIAIVVIGVISVLCIPTFIHFEQDKDIVTALKRSQSILAQATKMAESQNGNYENWDLDNLSETDIYNQFYRQNLKINKLCKNSNECWAETQDFKGTGPAPDGAKYGITGNSKLAMVLQDGMGITITKVKEFDEKFGLETKTPNNIIFMVDVNGQKGPNSMGRDVFAFTLGEQGKIIPAGKDNDSFNCKKNCDLDDDFWDCSAKVLNDEKRDYI